MNKPTLVLLKRNGIYLVVNGHGDAEHDMYFYNEHTCPTNYMGDVEAVIYEKDADPHGVFEWVATIDKPEDFEEGLPREFNELCVLFPELMEDQKMNQDQSIPIGASFTAPKIPTAITFDDHETGSQSSLFWKDGKLHFEGDVDSSARIFMDFLLKSFNECVESEINNRTSFVGED